MSESERVPAARQGLCEFPGVHCPNDKQPDVASGRPAKYCGQEGPGLDGRLVVHTKANAYTATRRLERERAKQADTGAAADRAAVGEHSAARLTLEHQMTVFPRELEQFKSFLSDVVDTVEKFADADAVAAELQQLQAEHRVQLAEAEQQRGDVERRRRAAEQRAADAEQAKSDADEAAEEAIADLETARAETAAALEAAATARADAEAARTAAAEQVGQIQADAERQIHELQAAADEQVQRAHAETEAARIAQAAAESDQHAARAAAAAAETSRAETQAELRNVEQFYRTEIEKLRADARTERAQLRADHQAVLADVKQAAEGRVEVLTIRLRDAEQTVNELRRQRDENTDTQGSPPRRRGRDAGGGGEQ